MDAYEALLWISDGTMASLMKQKTGECDGRYDTIELFRNFVLHEAKQLVDPLHQESWMTLFNKIDFTKWEDSLEYKSILNMRKVEKKGHEK